MERPSAKTKREREQTRREARQARVQRRLHEQAGAARRRWMTRFAYIGGAAIAVALIIAWIAVQTFSPKPGEEFPDLGNQHIQDPEGTGIRYASDPPTSGPHTPYIAPWGIHQQPIQKAVQTHNLEDGGVVIQYSQSASKETIEKLTALVRQYSDRVILAPYPQAPAPIVLTAWTRMDRLSDYDEERIKRFINAYRGKDHHR